MPQLKLLLRSFMGGSLLLALTISLSLLSGNTINFTFLNNFLNRHSETQNFYFPPSEPQTQPIPEADDRLPEIPITIEVPIDPTFHLDPNILVQPDIEVNPILEWNFEAGTSPQIEVSPSLKLAPVQEFNFEADPFNPSSEIDNGLTLINQNSVSFTTKLTAINLSEKNHFSTATDIEDDITLLVQLLPAPVLITAEWDQTFVSASDPSQLLGLLLIAILPLSRCSKCQWL
ncbi:MAG: hypothetical protein F6K04_18585 [Leptolyngbya sp. SIO4C5]|nr:hypothetical protein [Leptolyngbya sp. SIO4C5]